MLSLGLTHIGRRATLVASAVAIVSAVACSDDATAPRPAATSIPTSGPQAMILPARSLVTVRIKTVWGTLLTDKANVKFFAAGDSGVIMDNSAADKDLTVGVITVALPWSSTFKACLVTDTKNYGIDVTKPYCNTVTGNVSTVEAGSLVMHEFPIGGVYVQDMAGNPITGGTFTFTAPPSDGFTTTVADGGGNDLSPGVNGNIVFKGNRPGLYTWCETVAPTGYYLTSPNCGTISMYWDLGTGIVVHHQKKLIVVPF